MARSGVHNRGLEKLEERLEQARLEADDRNFSDVLECAICLDVCRDPAFFCINGHLICGICKESKCNASFIGCPTCREPKLRKFEGFSDWKIKYCKFACPNGCGNLAANFQKSLEHHSVCWLPEVAMNNKSKCPVTSCSQEIEENGLRSHVSQKHPEMCYEFTTKLSVSIEMPELKLAFLLGFDKVVTVTLQQMNGIKASAFFTERICQSEDKLWIEILFKNKKTNNIPSAKDRKIGPSLIFNHPNLGKQDPIFTSNYSGLNNYYSNLNGDLILSATFTVSRTC